MCRDSPANIFRPRLLVRQAHFSAFNIFVLSIIANPVKAPSIHVFVNSLSLFLFAEFRKVKMGVTLLNALWAFALLAASFATSTSTTTATQHSVVQSPAAESDPLPDPILDIGGNPFLTIEFLNSSELINQPTAIWANYSQTFMAIGNLDGSLVRMNETSTHVLVEPMYMSSTGEPDEHAIFGVASDGHGNIFFSQFYHCTIRRVSADGEVTIFAGHAEAHLGAEAKGKKRVRSGQPYSCGFTADGNPANESTLSYPGGLQFDPKTHSLFFSDHAGMVIRHFDAKVPSSDLHTLAGRPESEPGFDGDNGPANQALLGAARYFWLSPYDNKMYIADALNNRIRVVDMSTKQITSLSGSFGYPYSITGDHHGNLYTSSADSFFFVNRTKISNGEVVRFAGTGKPVRGEVLYGQFSTRVPVSNASFVFFERSIGLMVAQEDVHNILLVTSLGSDLHDPTTAPTISPSPSASPTFAPSTSPSKMPSVEPTAAPSAPSHEPTIEPTAEPTRSPTAAPTVKTPSPSAAPSRVPTVAPTVRPTAVPTNTGVPTRRPTATPTIAPTTQTLPVLTVKTELTMGGFTSENLSTDEKDSVREGTGRALGVDKTYVTIDSITRKTRRQLLDVSSGSGSVQSLAVTSSKRGDAIRIEAIELIFGTTINMPVANLVSATNTGGSTASINMTALALSLKSKIVSAVSSGNLTQLIQQAAADLGVTSLNITVTGVAVQSVVIEEPPATDDSDKKDTDVGLIVGVVIGGGAAVLLILAVMVYCLRGDSKVIPVYQSSAHPVGEQAIVPAQA